VSILDDGKVIASVEWVFFGWWKDRIHENWFLMVRAWDSMSRWRGGIQN